MRPQAAGAAWGTGCGMASAVDGSLATVGKMAYFRAKTGISGRKR